jgi:hypothetical protein
MRRFLPSPSMLVAGAALFAALGGTSYAALNSSSAGACSSGSKLKGSALVNGHTSFSHKFVKVSGFNCSGKAIQAKRIAHGHYEVKFVGNPDSAAVGSIVDKANMHDDAFVSFTRIKPGDFEVLIYNAVIGGANIGNEDRPFSIALP